MTAVFSVFLLFGGSAFAQQHFAFEAASASVSQPNIEVRLVSSQQPMARGGEGFVGLQLMPHPEWHVYWLNPGDSGLAPSIEWELPPGVQLGSFLWPRPQQLPMQHLMNFGYHGEVVLPMSIELDDGYRDKALAITAHASWLVCKEECIPGKATLTLTLAVGETAKESEFATLINHYRALEPATLSLLDGQIKVDDEIELRLYAASPVFKGAQNIVFYPINDGLVEHGKSAQLSWKNNVIDIRQARSVYFSGLPKIIEGVLVVDDSKAWKFSLQP